MKAKTKQAQKKSPLRFEPTKIEAAITVECTAGGPAVAGLIARLLLDAGAVVTLGDDRIVIPSSPGPVLLGGLEVHVARVVWAKAVRK